MPQGVRGPVDFKALARRAARDRGVSRGERRRGMAESTSRDEAAEGGSRRVILADPG